MNKTRWIRAILSVNWANMVTNKKSFYTMMLLMCVQNLIYFGLWIVIFQQISSLKGWGLNEVGMLFASATIGYGFFFAVFGGLNQLATMIHNGELDLYLARPRSTLLLALLQRARGDSIGDILTGIVMLGLFLHPPLAMLPLLFVLAVSSGMVFFAFRLICHSLAFWGSDDDAAERSFSAFLIIATNPQKGFGPLAKVALLTIFPAGYVGLLPVEIMRHFDAGLLAVQLVASAVLLGFAVWLFHRGLRRYSSGNRFLALR